MTFDEALVWLLRAYAVFWLVLVVGGAMRDRDAWRTPPRGRGAFRG